MGNRELAADRAGGGQRRSHHVPVLPDVGLSEGRAVAAQMETSGAWGGDPDDTRGPRWFAGRSWRKTARGAPHCPEARPWVLREGTGKKPLPGTRMRCAQPPPV